MSFTSNLIKGFIRSAVNQVGRDGGRVISNKIYQNNHSTPISHTNILQNINNLEEVPQHQQERINTSNNIIKYIVAFIFTYSLPIIGSIITMIYGAIKMGKTSKNIYKTEQKRVQIADKRYKEGYRLENKMVTYTIKEPLSTENLLIVQKKGKTYLLIGVSYIVVFILILIVSNIISYI